MVLHNFLAYGQANPGPGIFGFAVQSLEYLKYPVHIFLLKTNSVVPNRNEMVLLVQVKAQTQGIGKSCGLPFHPDFGASLGMTEFNSVMEKIGEQLDQLGGGTHNH